MFNDKYGLTEAVLNGRKTQTRRVIPYSALAKAEDRRLAYFNASFDVVTVEQILLDDGHLSNEKPLFSYKIGEVVAVAQSYKSIGDEVRLSFFIKDEYKKSAGMTNKMFVKAGLMPHHIRITNIRVERLQDISNEDCMAEGIHRTKFGDSISYYFERGKNFYSARDAYATLIDKVSGKGTWDSNPWVFVYDFELVD